MGGICVILLMLFCAIWILCMLFLSIFIPLVAIYNGIVGLVCLVVYFILRKKVGWQLFLQCLDTFLAQIHSDIRLQ